MLSWEKIDAIPGWFMFQSYCVWRALLDQQTGTPGDLFEIGVWRGRSASVLANYRKGDEKLYLCDLRLDEPAVQKSIRSTGIEPANLVPLSGPSAGLPATLDLKAMHHTVRWLHIDGEHTGTAVYRELELANQIVNGQGIVVVDDFFSPRYPANTTAVPRYMDFMASGMSPTLQSYGAKTTIFKTTGPWDTDAVGITDFVEDAGAIAGPDNEPQRWQMMRTRHVWSPVRHLQNGWRMLRGR